MHRRTLLATVPLLAFSGCTAIADSLDRRSESETNVDDEAEGELVIPGGEPTAEVSIGDSSSGVDPHLVAVRNASAVQNLGIRVRASEYDMTAHEESYSLTADEYVRFELQEPIEYTIELFDAEGSVGDPYVIEADWFEYDCPFTVIERRDTNRIAASTVPEADEC